MDAKGVWTRLFDTNLPNPGKFEDASRELRSVVVDRRELRDGFNFQLGKTVNVSSKHTFGTMHAMSMGAKEQPAEYGFAALLQNDKGMIQVKYDTNKMLLATTDQKLSENVSMNAFYQHQYGPIPPGMMIPGAPNVMRVEVDYKGKDFTSTAKIEKFGSITLSHMQSLTKRLSAGMEAAYHPKKRSSELAGALRYAPSKQAVFSATANAEGSGSASYVHRLSEKIAVGSEVVYERAERESKFRAGYEYQTATSRIRGGIDSQLRLCSSVEERLAPAFVFAINGDVDAIKGEYRFGMGVTIG